MLRFSPTPNGAATTRMGRRRGGVSPVSSCHSRLRGGRGSADRRKRAPTPRRPAQVSARVGLGRFYSSHGKLPGPKLNALYLAMGGLVGQQTTSWMVLLGALLLLIGVILAVAFVGTSWLEDRRFRRGSDSLARVAGSREPSTFLPPTPMAADPTLTDTRQQGRWEPFSLSPGKLTRRPTTAGLGSESGGGPDDSAQPGHAWFGAESSADDLAKKLEASRGDDFTFVRLRIRLSDSACLPTTGVPVARSPVASIIRRDAVRVPRSAFQELCETARDKGAGRIDEPELELWERVFQELWETARDKGKDTISEDFAGRIDEPGRWERVTHAWRTRDPGDFGAAGEYVDNFGRGMHEVLVGRPTQSLAVLFGVPDSEAISALAAEVPIPGLDEPVNAVVSRLDIIGVVAGAATGHLFVATAGLKALIHRGVHEMVFEAVKTALFSPSPHDRNGLARSASERSSRGSGRFPSVSPPNLPPEQEPAGRSQLREALAVPSLGDRRLSDADEEVTRAMLTRAVAVDLRENAS